MIRGLVVVWVAVASAMVGFLKSEWTKENPRGVWWDTCGGRWGWAWGSLPSGYRIFLGGESGGSYLMCNLIGWDPSGGRVQVVGDLGW